MNMHIHYVTAVTWELNTTLLSNGQPYTTLTIKGERETLTLHLFTNSGEDAVTPREKQ